MNESKIVLSKSSDGVVSLPVALGTVMVWLTQAQMGDLFGKDQSVISRHVRNAIADGEEIPPFLCVIDSVKAALMKTDVAKRFFEDKSMKLYGESAEGHPTDFTGFESVYKVLGDKLRPQVYTYGFLRV